MTDASEDYVDTGIGEVADRAIKLTHSATKLVDLVVEQEEMGTPMKASVSDRVRLDTRILRRPMDVSVREAI